MVVGRGAQHSAGGGRELTEFAAAEGHVARRFRTVVVVPSERPDALLQRQQRLVDLRALDFRLLGVGEGVAEPLGAGELNSWINSYYRVQEYAHRC